MQLKGYRQKFKGTKYIKNKKLNMYITSEIPHELKEKK